jgi:hypothetical protein
MMTVRQARLIEQIKRTTDPAKRTELEQQLAAERQRGRRRGPKTSDWLPAQVLLKKLVTLDRPTELAVEFLAGQAGNGKDELAELLRQAIQEKAKQMGWKE